jgi:hypothetical protein
VQPTVAAVTTAPISATANEVATDWIAVLLGVVAFIMLIGLIPLWYAVYLAWQ